MAKKAQAAPTGDGIADVLAMINSRYGSEAYPVARMGTELIQPGWITTGNILIDVEAFGGEGYQEGTVTEAIGWPQAGKTKHCQRSIVAAQKARPDQYVLVLAGERGDYTPESLADRGIDPTKIIVLQDMPAEQMLQSLLDFLWDEKKNCPKNLISLWVIDSAPMLVPTAVLENPLTEQDARAELARVYARFIPKVNLHMGSSCGLIVNQLRQGQGTTPADKKPHTPGGIAIPYACKVILRFYDYGVEKQTSGDWSEQHDTSMKICVEVAKNNLVRGARGARMYYKVYLMEDDDHAVGVDEIENLVRAALILGVVYRKNQGSWRYFTLDGQEYGASSLTNLVPLVKEKGFAEALEQEVRDRARIKLVKSRTPLGKLVVTPDGELLDAAEADDASAQELEQQPPMLDELTGEVMQLEEDTQQYE